LWRVQPFDEFDLETGGWGAWEIAARYSHIDLDDGVNDLAGGGIRGGVGTIYTLALNWYPNALVRISANYVHADIDNLSDTGLSEGDVIDAIGFRLQWEF
jgi:phosphate-selective porin OprO/OprP